MKITRKKALFKATLQGEEMGKQNCCSNAVNKIQKYDKIMCGLQLMKLKLHFHDLTEPGGQRIPTN